MFIINTCVIKFWFLVTGDITSLPPIKTISGFSIFVSGWRESGEIMEILANHATMPTNSGRLDP